MALRLLSNCATRAWARNFRIKRECRARDSGVLGFFFLGPRMAGSWGAPGAALANSSRTAVSKRQCQRNYSQRNSRATNTAKRNAAAYVASWRAACRASLVNVPVCAHLVLQPVYCTWRHSDELSIWMPGQDPPPSPHPENHRNVVWVSFPAGSCFKQLVRAEHASKRGVPPRNSNAHRYLPVLGVLPGQFLLAWGAYNVIVVPIVAAGLARHQLSRAQVCQRQLLPQPPDHIVRQHPKWLPGSQVFRPPHVRRFTAR